MNHVLKSINQTTKNHQKPPKKPNKLSFGHQVAIPNLRQRYGEFRAEGSYIMLDIYIYISSTGNPPRQEKRIVVRKELVEISQAEDFCCGLIWVRLGPDIGYGPG
jgi:hypothetical protein